MLYMKKKRHIYRLAAGIMLSALIITGLPAGQAQAADDKMTVKLTKGKGKAYTKKLKKGVKLKLTAKLGKKKLSRKYLSFKTSKKSVASVSKTGVIKAKKAGTAWITVTYKKKQTKRKARIKVKITSPVQKKETGIGNYKPYTVNGKKTIKTYLLNGLVPCGRTLYIYGGGWGSYGTQIGYQQAWKDFFDSHAKESYDYSKYKFQRDKGFDCSGFAGWTLYNTLYKESDGEELSISGSDVAKTYADNGWAVLTKNSKDKTFKPGDVISKPGHVWISMGQCEDGSVLILHSTPQSGVQISGSKGKAAELAAYYMKKYFPAWPFTAKHMGEAYITKGDKARWKVSGKGAIMSDPEGFQEMTGEQVLQKLLGD